MKRLLHLFLALGMAFAAMNGAAAPPRRADIPANPLWMLHVDCEALRQTYLGKYLLYQLDKPEMYSNMMSFRSIFSFDFRTQLYGLTMYGTTRSPQDNVVIMYGDFDPSRLIALTRKADAPKEITRNHHVIYCWNDKLNGPNGGSGPRNYAFIQKNRMIKTQSEESLLEALAVMDGTAPNLSASKELPELSPADGVTFIQGTARNLDFLGSGTNAALLRMSKRTKFQASEKDEQFTAVLTLDAGQESAAQQMSLAARGLIALFSLQKDNAKTAQLVKGMSVKQNGATLTVTLSVPSTELITAIKASTAKNEPPRAAGE